jgi:large subunit ribosomal protein L25
VVLPEGVTLKSDPKMVVIHLSVRTAVEEVVPVAAAEGEAAAPAEGEAAAPAEGGAEGEKK